MPDERRIIFNYLQENLSIDLDRDDEILTVKLYLQHPDDSARTLISSSAASIPYEYHDGNN